MLAQTGVFREGEAPLERVLDSNDLERERGITIFAKHASVLWRGVRINVIDTPGHADFGGEVERTLRMADGAMLLVDAAEGPLPQTRFVLGKAIELGMPIVVVINKIDRQDARPEETLEAVFDLFCELDASDEQADFPVLYAVGKRGVASRSLEEPGRDLSPLFDAILETIPPPAQDPRSPLQLLVHNTVHDDYVGRLAIGRIWAGRLSRRQRVVLLGADARRSEHEVGTLWGFRGLSRVRIESAEAGDIVAVSGIPEVTIGDTLADPAAPEALPRIAVEEPTIRVRFHVNTSPFAGRDGRFVTSRHLRERLLREAERNIALRVEETTDADTFEVSGRGELMLAVLAETMRREGYEFAMGMPQVVLKAIDGAPHEPFERVLLDVAEEHVGPVTRALGERRGQMIDMQGGRFGRSRLTFRIPARGLIGFRSTFLTLTRGSGLMGTLFDGWEPYLGPMLRRREGAIVSDRAGRTTPYALFHLQPRGVLFVGPGVEVYEGMVLGEHNRGSDLDVNPTREKKLTNLRAAGKDENIVLTPPRSMDIEAALEWIDQDELVEVTPQAVRIRKRVLACNRRPRRDGPKRG